MWAIHGRQQRSQGSSSNVPWGSGRRWGQTKPFCRGWHMACRCGSRWSRRRVAFQNHPSYFKHKAFVEEEMKRHIADGAFRVISKDQARVVHPLQVEPKGQNDVRMCVDARFVNTHLASLAFELETLQRNGPDVIQKGNGQFTSDIRKAYYGVEMDEDACPYLCWEHDGRIYMALVLIFGLSLAPATFHKLMRE